jgi:hypothetical protein
VTRDELEHIIRAACDVAGDEEVYILGSQAILGRFPDAPALLRRSVEADVAPRTKPARWEAIDGSLGEMSRFHMSYNVYAHGIEIATAKLPGGWKKRVVRVRSEATRGNTGWCLEPHDLAASKLAAGRDKDKDFVRVLLTEQLIDAKVLMARIQTLDVPAVQSRRMIDWVLLTVTPPKGRRSKPNRRRR